MDRIQAVLLIGMVLIFLVVPYMLAIMQNTPTAETQPKTADTKVSNVPDNVIVYIEPCGGSPKYNDEEVEIALPPHYDIPLSVALQDHVYSQLERFGLPEDTAKIVFAMMYVESRYDADAASDDGNCRGLLQIHKIHDEDLAELGVTDLFDPYQNITAGVSILAGCVKWASDYPEDDRMIYALLAYNNGTGGARKKIAEGDIQTAYVCKVLAARDELKLLR